MKRRQEEDCFAKQLYFLFFKFNYGVNVENGNLIVRHITYFQCSSPVFAMEAFGDGWRGGLVVGRRTCNLRVAGSIPGRDAAAQQP